MWRRLCLKLEQQSISVIALGLKLEQQSTSGIRDRSNQIRDCFACNAWPRVLASTCCCGAAPQASFKAFQFFTLFFSLFFSLTSLGLMWTESESGALSLNWNETLSLSLSHWTVITFTTLLYNFICPCFDFIRWWVCLFVYCKFIWLALVSRLLSGGWIRGPWGGIFELGK